MPNIPSGTLTAIAIIGITVIVLLFAMVSPSALSNILAFFFVWPAKLLLEIGQGLQWFATWLFKTIRPAFHVNHTIDPNKVAEPTAAQISPTSPIEATQPTAEKGKAASKSSKSEETGDNDLWIGIALFSRFMFFVFLTCIFISDFEFVYIAVSDIILHEPVNTFFTNNLGPFTGLLFIAVELLSGALLVEAANWLPPAARIYPKLSIWSRLVLGFFAVVSMVLTAASAVVLAIARQRIITDPNSAPLQSPIIVIAGVILLAQIISILFSLYGWILGFALTIAILLAAVAGVIWLISKVITFVGSALEAFARTVIPAFIELLHQLLRPGSGGSEPPLPSESAVSVIGYGDLSARLTQYICEDIDLMFRKSGLIAAGVYADNLHTKREVANTIDRLSVPNVSPSDDEAYPARIIANNLRRVYLRYGRQTSKAVLVWVVDGDAIDPCETELRGLRTEFEGLTIMLMCFYPLQGDLSQLNEKLEHLATPDDHGVTAVSSVFIIDRKAPLFTHAELANKLIAQSLAGITLAPTHSSANPSFQRTLRELAQGGYPFAALAIDSTGVVAIDQPIERGWRWLRRFSSPAHGKVSLAQTIAQCESMTQRLIEHGDAYASAKIPGAKYPTHVAYTVPLSRSDKSLEKFAENISSWLANAHDMRSVSVVTGNGVNLSDIAPAKVGDRYCQVMVLYGFNPHLTAEVEDEELVDAVIIEAS